MVRTVEIGEDTYRRLKTLAQARGLSIEQILDRLVKQEEALPQSTAIDQLRASGFFVNDPHTGVETTVDDFQPVDLQPGSKPVSQILIEERH